MYQIYLVIKEDGKEVSKVLLFGHGDFGRACDVSFDLFTRCQKLLEPLRAPFDADSVPVSP